VILFPSEIMEQSKTTAKLSAVENGQSLSSGAGSGWARARMKVWDAGVGELGFGCLGPRGAEGSTGRQTE